MPAGNSDLNSLCNNRFSALNLLLGGILAALVVLVLVVASGRSDSTSGSGNAARAVKPIGNTDRIKATLQVGRTYRSVVKVNLDAKVNDKDWSLEKVANLTYAGEAEIHRKIEANDGNESSSCGRSTRCDRSSWLPKWSP